jgi:endonuclease YncB( thermonuclease family)
VTVPARPWERPLEFEVETLRITAPAGHHGVMALRLLSTLLLALALVVPCQADTNPVLEGVVVGVVDGDTADIRLASGMIRVRLHAIDAPERDQPHGEASKQALSKLVFGRTVAVEPFEQDRYDRLVARLWLDETDVNAELVKQGAAWIYRRYAGDAAYCAYEKGARDLRRGLWALPVSQRPAPWEWRRRKTLGQHFTDYSTESVAACVASLGR